MSAEQRAIHEEVVLAPHDAAWSARFDLERDRLAARYPQLLRIEHVGSTAIPGMTAKPIIDILAGVESMTVADGLFELLLDFGYTTSREFNATLVDRRWFMRSADGRRTHHLHLVILGSAAWIDHLRFRDALRADASLARRYATLKSELAQRYRLDREAYTDAKSAFVAEAIAAA